MQALGPRVRFATSFPEQPLFACAHTWRADACAASETLQRHSEEALPPMTHAFRTLQMSAGPVGLRWTSYDAQGTPAGALIVFVTGDSTTPVRNKRSNMQ